MKATSNEPVRLTDLWSASSDYRAAYQSGDEIRTVVQLLDLGTAATLVDVGCGNGAFAIAAARQYPRCRVLAFDALASAIQQCRADASEIGLQRLTTGVSRAESIPLPHASVDRALCRSVLHHVPDATAVYAELARVLKPGGLLLLQAPCNYWQKSVGAVIAELYRLMDDSHPRYYHRPGEIINDLSDASLATRNVACWTYVWDGLSSEQVAFVRQARAAQRFRLRQGDDGKWLVNMYWVRILAEKLS